MPHYVILLHEMPPAAARPTHWDFMLEDGESLKTWALECELRVGEAVQAQQLADHRRDYLSYEGPVSNDRGMVTRWDEGVFEWIDRSDSMLSISLSGKRLSGVARFVCDSQADEAVPQRWSVSLRKT